MIALVGKGKSERNTNKYQYLLEYENMGFYDYNPAAKQIENGR
jgi:hypothetical protein